jgi:DNA polymerase
MTTLRIDLETYSSVDLRKCGMHRYVESPDFEIMLFAYAFDAEPVRVIDLMQDEPLPPEVETAIFDPNVIKTAYNAAFELACLGRHFGRALDPMQWRCTSVHALYLGLPGNLADVGKVVGLPEDQQKKRSGSVLIRYFCIPCKPTKANMGRTRNRPTHDREKWRLFKDYCAGDVVAEREIANRLAKFPVPDKEHRLWALDQRMNNKGVMIDRELVESAIICDQIYKQRLTNEAIRLTGLSNPNSRNQLLAWLIVEDGTDVDDLTKKTVPLILKSTENNVVQRVMELRQQLAKTSVSKYHAMQRSACDDAAVRGLTQFYGANRTGRWAGRLVQVQNLPQNKHRDIDLARNLMRMGDYEGIDNLFGSVFDTMSQLIRTAFVARPGHKFVIVDFSAIEARVVAWLAWCPWRIDVFNTHGKIYEASAEQMFKLPKGSVDKKSPYRFKGKVAELALGYGGGAGALKTMGALDMGLTEDELEPIKVAWREANPEVVQFWYDCESAAKMAVAHKTSVDVPIAGKRASLVFSWESGFLFIALPSGRRLAYVKPRIEAEDLYREKSDGSKFQIARAGSLTYEGLDQKTKQWTRVPTYGGKLVENITQAIARDLLAEAMLALDDEGFTLLTTVHDEVVCEEPIDGPRDVHLAEEIMGRPIPWAKDLPLRGDGFETPYYMKEID